MLGRPYLRQESSKSIKCDICGYKRANLSAHLLRMHSVSKKSKELKGFGTKIQATKRIAEGKYASIENVLDIYNRDYFKNLDGASRSLKPETDVKYKKRKLDAVRQALYWLIDRTKETELNALMIEIKCLGEDHTGYFDMLGKVNSSKGIFFLTYLWISFEDKLIFFFPDAGFLVEFVSFLIRDKLGDLDILQSAQTRLEKMRCNLQARGGFHRAKFQERDSKIFITDVDLENFFASSRPTSARKALAGNEDLTVRQIINVRNFLITSLIIENSCRPAALYALSRSSVKQAMKFPKMTESGVLYYSVASFYDKTVSSSGLPTYLVMSEPLMAHISVYAGRFWSDLAKRSPNSPDDLFLLEHGLRMDSESISNSFRKFTLPCHKGEGGSRGEINLHKTC